MRYRLTAGACLAAAMLAGAPLAAQAQNRPDRIMGHPNLNGIWHTVNTAYWNLEAHSAMALDQIWQLGALGAMPAGLGVVREGEIPYLSAALEKRDQNRAGWPAADPVTKCYMPGIPRAMYQPFPFQIFQGNDPDLLMVYSFATSNRTIHVKDQMEPPVDTWMGRSNGHWEGDTLVIDTHGFNGKTWLDRSGNYYSGDARVTERLDLVDSSHIRYQATIEDPSVYSKPWTIVMTLYRDTDPDALLLEYKCVPFADKLLYQDLLSSSGDDSTSDGGNQQ
jgi:hypothetical protein